MEEGVCSRPKQLAPFASVEDLSDQSSESPFEKDAQTEMKDPCNQNLMVTNVAPRIDISRASSSSHHEDSSPDEREIMNGKLFPFSILHSFFNFNFIEIIFPPPRRLLKNAYVVNSIRAYFILFCLCLFSRDIFL